MAADKSFNVGEYAKAVVGGLAAGSGVALTALADGKLSVSEIVAVALAVLASYGVVYTVPNSNKPGLE